MAATQSRKLLGEDVLNVTVQCVESIAFEIGDNILAFGTVYTLNRLPKAAKESDRGFRYDLTFEGPQYSLMRALYLNQDATGFATGPEFTLTGTLDLFANVLLTNVSRALGAGNWLLGNVPTGTPTLNLSFDGENCLAVLQRLCTEFETEFTITRSSSGVHTIHFGKQGELLGHTFEYGRGRGLYAISRQTPNDEGFITRLYAYGGSQNIPQNYRNYSSRLRLDDGLSYLDNAQVQLAFGLIEGTVVWDEIFPKRTGKLSGVGIVTDGVKTFTVTDATMDFNLLEESGPAQTVNGKEVKQYRYLMPGVSPKLHFQSGNLAGYEFEINTYDHASKTFTLVGTSDERGMAFPSATSAAFQPSAGDTYVLIDVIMPDSYVQAAEQLLNAKALSFLGQHSTPSVQYDLTIDEQFLNAQSGTGSTVNHFELGDYVHVKDDSLSVDGASRVIGFSRNLIFPNQYQLEIADTYQVTRIEQLLADQKATNTLIKINQLTDANRARQGWRTTQELLSMVFDTDDFFDAGNIRPESIETSMIVVGAKSQQFILNCVIEPNFEGQPNVVKGNSGSLTHYTVEETIRTWQITGQTITITDDSARYIYAKCNKSNYTDASLLFSTDQIKPNQDGWYYHFLVGVLHAKDATTNVRWVSLTYGATSINGRFIKTGRIQSFDGLTYFDLDLGEMGGKITFIATDGIKRPISELTQTTIDGGIITSGMIMLAGAGGTVRAGISGEGTSDASVRFWAGASYTNRAVAPFRVLQSGEMFARKRIELMNENNVGQAGISGSNATADGKVRFWAGSPYANRNTAPFRVLADGSMIATAGKIGAWQISNSGILNEDGLAYIITRTSTNPMRTEARIGAQVFPASFGGKGAAMFVANEPDMLFPNYAAVFEAANGGNNYAIYAQKGTALLGEALLNGRRYFGQTLTDLTIIIDPSNYDVIEIFPQGSSAGIRFATPSQPIGPGKEIAIINSNDTTSGLILINIIRGNNSYALPGGCVLTLIYSNGYWYGKSQYDNNYGTSTPPFVIPPVNPAPTVNGAIPNFSTTSRDNNQYQIPSSIFNDPGDTLNFDVISNLPTGVTFSGGGRILYLDKDVVENGSFSVTVRVTDSAGQSVGGVFQVMVNWPTLNPAPIVANPIANLSLAGNGQKTFSIATNTFQDTDELTFVASRQDGQGLPDGFTYSITDDALLFVIAAAVATGVFQLRVTATDTAGQSVNADFTLSLNRSAVNNPPTVVAPVQNQTISGNGQQTFGISASMFSDPGDSLTITVTGANGGALPAGITYDPTYLVFTLAASVGSGTYPVEVKATDSAGQSVVSGFSFIVVRNADEDIVVRADPADFDEEEPVSGDGFDTSYTYSKTGSDVAGNQFVSTPAPRLLPVSQTKPRPTGNSFSFTPQSAINTVLPKRFSPLTQVHPKKAIGYPGTIYLDWSTPNEIIGLYTHTTESAKTNTEVYPTSLKRMVEGSFYVLAANAAAVLPAGDSRKQQLLDWAGPQQAGSGSYEGPHILITDASAARLYGAEWWKMFKQLDWKGAGVEHFSVNMEHMEERTGTAYTKHQQQYRMIGWITEGCINAAAADGVTLFSPLSAEFGNLTIYAPWFHDRPATHDREGNALPNPNPNIPQYMHYALLDEYIRGNSPTAPLGENSTLATLIKTGKAAVGVGRYLQHTMDGQTYWQKQSNGALITDSNNNPIFRNEPDRYTTITGQQCVIYKDDYYMAMIKLYGIVAQFCSNMRFMAGGVDLPFSTTRQAGWEGMKGQVTQFRLDVEGESGIDRPDGSALNERPLAPFMVEGYGILMYVFAEFLRGWMQSQMPSNLGADTGYGSKARASAEIYAKAFERAANLNWIHDISWQLIQPSIWIKDQGFNGPADPDEHFARKPILLGGLGTYQGDAVMWFLAWWPCQDEDKSTDIKIWADKGTGPITGSYVARMVGRTPFLDYWKIPAGTQPKDWYMQFQSLTNIKITRRGDYREAKITNHPTPPANV
ncbi:hypothetical protein GCM10028806_28590 [Spirosoma terrae]